MSNGATTMTTTPATAAEMWTTGSLIMIAVAIVVVLIAIVWGARLKRERKAADAEIAADTRTAPEPRVEAPPVAPAPPPLADTPVVATTPYEASPATVAADLAAPPEPPAPPAPAATPAGDDDLTQLKGVGPRLAVRLGELGVTRYAQIAELTPAQADALDAELGAFRGRLGRDRWIEQANYLAKGDRDGFEAAFGKL